MLILWLAVMMAGTVLATSGVMTIISRSRFRTRTVSSIKILTPLDDPMGPVLELIQWAEQRAVAEHQAVFGGDGQRTIEFRHPELGIIKQRVREQIRTGQVTVLEDFSFRTANEHRERMGFENVEAAHIRMANGQYGRYLEDIGYVTADSPELLNRACRVVLGRKYDQFTEMLTSLDHRIRAYAGIPDGPTVAGLREQRVEVWEKTKVIIETMEKLLSQSNGHQEYDQLRQLVQGAYHGVGPEVRAHSHWVMDYKNFSKMRHVADSAGHPLWTPSVDVAGPEYLMGIPIQISEGGGTPHLEPN